jgi:hypothetical protein
MVTRLCLLAVVAVGCGRGAANTDPAATAVAGASDGLIVVSDSQEEDSPANLYVVRPDGTEPATSPTTAI